MFLTGDLDGDETEILHLIRKKLATMCSCFSQLSHKALTIFQINCKAEVKYKITAFLVFKIDEVFTLPFL